MARVVVLHRIVCIDFLLFLFISFLCILKYFEKSKMKSSSKTHQGMTMDSLKTHQEMTMDSLKTLASALVLNRIDYGNMALFSLPKVATQSVQSIINTTARLITGVRKYDHITPVLKELHRLKADERIVYKIALRMYKCLSNEGFSYLTRDLFPVASLPDKQRLNRLSQRTLFPSSTSSNH